MNTNLNLPSPARERLQRLERISPHVREVWHPIYWPALIVLLLALGIVAFGILGGTAASDLFRHYFENVKQLAD